MRSRSPRQAVLQPLRDFLHTEAAGGVVLVGATLVALLWANSPWSDAYFDLWDTDLPLDLTFQEWINDGLMTLFFFVVGLEIKRELVEGELRDRRQAATPALAALGGMVVPALIYLSFNAGGAGQDGWGIPIATDIAMAVGVLSLLGSRVVPSIKVYLLALAIVDDIGAIVVIAVFYASQFEVLPFLAALALVGAIVVVQRVGVDAVAVYVVLGAGLWLALHESGVHATLAGVALGLLTPTRPRRRGESESVVEWLEHGLHPWTSFVIVPLFALANAGIPISADSLSDAASSTITYGVIAGLVVGKLVGVTAATWLAVRLRIGDLPSGASWRSIVGIGALAGIGFTVSIFVTGLAFDEVALQDEAKLGILTASLLAAMLGAAVLTVRRR
jgi:Na+:H+ antiporter, NhaA family